MGEVYEAEDLRLNRARIALKTIRSDSAANQKVRERFQSEVLLARAVTHPNVCPVYEFFAANSPHGEIWFLTMKLLTGETLHSRLHREPKLPTQEALSIARQIAAALDAAHSAGIVHRDLKPGNIFLEQHRDGLCAIVTDFGLAKDWAVSPSQQSLDLVGTPGYIAPEVLKGRCATPQSDIYSFGVVLDQLIFGYQPRSTPAEAETKSIPQDPASRRALKVVRRCLDPQPELRYLSASAAIDALEHEPAVAFTRRKLIAAFAAGTCVTTAAGWLSKDPIERLLYPVPRPRRVALLTAPVKGASPEDASLLSGVVDSVGLMLSRAESFEKDLFVVPPRIARQQKAVEAAEFVGLFGVNLLLRVSANWVSDALHVTLDLLRAPGNSTIRSTLIPCPSSTLFHLPALVASGSAKLLDLSSHPAKWPIAAPQTDNAEAYAAYERARGLLALNTLPNIDKAIAELQSAVNKDPQFAEAWAALAQAYSARYWLTRDPAGLDLAERYVNKALALAPGLPTAFANRAVIESARGKYELAVQDLQSAARLDPDNHDLQLTLANTYASWGKLDRADEAFQKLLQNSPNDWMPLNDWGSLYFHRSNYKRAEQLFGQATLVAPNAALPWRNLGAVYLVTEQMENAQQALDRSITLLPSGEAYANRGTALFWLGRYREAAQAYKAAAALNPKRYAIWGNLGDAYQMLGSNSDARAAWDKAAQLAQASLLVNTQNAHALSSLGLYQAKLGEGNAALQTLKRLDATGTLDTDQLFSEALTYELLHRRDMALNLLKECMERGYPRSEINHAPELRALRNDIRFQKLAVG